MKENKIIHREQMREILLSSGIVWESLNDDMHWKIGDINFFPTTEKWNVLKKDIYSKGVMDLIDYIKSECQPKDIGLIPKLSVDQIFDIAKKVKPSNLYKICEEIHKEIYK